MKTNGNDSQTNSNRICAKIDELLSRNSFIKTRCLVCGKELSISYKEENKYQIIVKCLPCCASNLLEVINSSKHPIKEH